MKTHQEIFEQRAKLAEKPLRMRFRLLHGFHVNELGTHFKAKENPIVETNSDLVKKFGPKKFVKLSQSEVEQYEARKQKQEARKQSAPAEDTPAAAPQTSSEPSDDSPAGFVAGYDLDNSTVAELKEIAEAEEIDLQGAHLKADIVETLRAALKNRS